MFWRLDVTAGVKTIRKRKILCEGRFKRFVVEKGWEFVERTNCWGIVGIIAMTEDEKVILVEQYRVPVKRRVIEFPAGLADGANGNEGESLKEAARREFLEETGYQAKKLALVARGPISSASSSDIMSLFWATGLKKVARGGGDSMESITVHEVSLSKVDAWLRKREKEGILVDSKIYAGLYLLTRNK